MANAPDERVNVFPPNAEIEATASMVLSGGDRYVTIVQSLAFLFACVAILGIGRRLGLSRSAGTFGALAFATFTVVALQAPTALNDLVVASLLIVCAYFAMGSTRTELVLAALALALAVGTKGTAAFALPGLALFALSSQPRRRWVALAAAGAAGLVAGSFWFVVNVVHTGEPDGGVVIDRGGAGVLERIRLSVVDLLELSDGEAHGLLLSPLWGLGVFVLFAALAILLAIRRRFTASVVALVVGACAFFAIPTLTMWARIAGRAFGHVREAAGLDGAPSGPRLPDGFYESPMHSSYGLAFVVLFLGAGVLVVADVARRRLPLAAAFALAAVPLTLLVTALVLAYDPQRMRYVTFAVALAAAVFGVALRVRILAWASVVLAAVTLVVSIGYFVPRPGGISVLPGNRTTDRTARWFVQAGGGSGDAEAFRFMAQEIPGDATLALAVERNTYLYPAWDAGLRRTVLFVDEKGNIPESADWLVVGPGKTVDTERLESESWQLALASRGGWRLYGR